MFETLSRKIHDMYQSLSVVPLLVVNSRQLLFFPIDGASQEGHEDVDQLRKQITDVASQLFVAKALVSARDAWLFDNLRALAQTGAYRQTMPFQSASMRNSVGVSCLTHEQLQKLAASCGNNDAAQSDGVERLAKRLADLGVAVAYKDVIFLTPESLFENVQRLTACTELYRLSVNGRFTGRPRDMRYYTLLSNQGLFQKELADLMWEDHPPRMRNLFVSMLRELDLLVPLPDPGKDVAPLMLPAYDNSNEINKARLFLTCHQRDASPVLSDAVVPTRDLRAECFIPHGLYWGLVCRLLAYSERRDESDRRDERPQVQLYKDVAKVFFGPHELLFKLIESPFEAISVQLHGPPGEAAAARVAQEARQVLDDLDLKDLHNTFFIQSTDDDHFLHLKVSDFWDDMGSAVSVNG